MQSTPSWSQTPDWIFIQPQKEDTITAVGYSGICLNANTATQIAHEDALISLVKSIEINVTANVIDYRDRWDSLFKVFLNENVSEEVESYASEHVIVLDTWTNHKTAEFYELLGLPVKGDFPVSGFNVDDSTRVPDWIISPPEIQGMVFGVGEASDFLFTRNGWDVATKLARLSLASTIHVHISSVTTDEISGSKQQTKTMESSDVNQLLRLSRVLSRYYDDKNDTYYVLVGISTEEIGTNK